MNASAEFLSPAEAAQRLGVSVKALRIYERHGLVKPIRSSVGWRAYGPDQMARAAEIATLRALGLSLAQVECVLDGDAASLEPALAAHQAALESQIRQLTAMVGRVRGLRAGLACGAAPSVGDLARLVAPAKALHVAFDLPWPWGGERFELSDIRPLNYLTGPLGCGKTRMAIRLAETLPGAMFLDLDRAADGGAAARAQFDRDPALQKRVNDSLAWLLEDGATLSDALFALVVGLEVAGPADLIVDMVEQGLDAATQAALISRLRRRGPDANPLFLMTRSNVILDLAETGPDEAILYCPANHSPPIRVAPYAGAPGYDSVVTCLASPEVRARSEGMHARMPEVA
ncbi:MAG: MerR family transcriptional regulator [Aliidongia sp.]